MTLNTLALHLVEYELPGCVGDVLPEEDDTGIPIHLVPKTDVEQIDHREGTFVPEFRRVLGVEGF